MTQQSTIIPATSSNRKCWTANQCVSIGYTSSKQFLVTSRQNRSTPGVYTEVYLKQNTHYCVSVSGQSLGNSKAFVFVYNPDNKKRLIPNYTFLPSSCFGCAEAHFTTPSCANEYICLYLGVLFTSPCNGQQFCLQEIRVNRSHKKHYPPSNKDEHCPQTSKPCYPPTACYPPKTRLPSPPPTYCASPPPCPPQMCSPRVSPKHNNEEACEVVESHHHHYLSSPNDPYYTYHTEPYCPPKECEQKQKRTCPPPPLQCPYSPKSHTPQQHTKAPEHKKHCQDDPVTIKDLQDHLNSMIASMK